MGFLDDIRPISDTFIAGGAIIISLCVSVCIILALYRRIRHAIPARVNCWFCNSNTKVAYIERNAWTCPSCHQYNGFSVDGDYNKRIAAQSVESLNKPVGASTRGESSFRKSNGLCSQCNMNQELKTFQLASFVPVCEDNFDNEIEAEQKRLEEIYSICENCRVYVEKVLTPKSNSRASRRLEGVERSKCGSSHSPLIHSVWTVNTPASPQDSTESIHRSLLSSDEDSDSGNSQLFMDKLHIGPKAKHSNAITKSPTLRHSSAKSSFTSRSFQPTVGNNLLQLPPSRPYSPLWKDYPSVRTSPYTSMSSVSGYRSPSNSIRLAPSVLNYSSSSVATIFGGRLTTPTKLPINSNHSLGIFSYAASERGDFLENPISRSSSQSSGFISQTGFQNSANASAFSTAKNSVASEYEQQQIPFLIQSVMTKMQPNPRYSWFSEVHPHNNSSRNNCNFDSTAYSSDVRRETGSRRRRTDQEKLQTREFSDDNDDLSEYEYASRKSSEARKVRKRKHCRANRSSSEDDNSMCLKRQGKVKHDNKGASKPSKSKNSFLTTLFQNKAFISFSVFFNIFVIVWYFTQDDPKWTWIKDFMFAHFMYAFTRLSDQVTYVIVPWMELCIRSVYRALSAENATDTPKIQVIQLFPEFE